MSKKIMFSIIVLFQILGSCNFIKTQEIARLQINQLTEGANVRILEVSIPLNDSEKIEICTDIDLSYKKELEMLFVLEILKDGNPYDVIEVNPLGKTQIPKKQDISCRLVLDTISSGLVVKGSGIYTIRGMLISPKNTDLVIEKAEIYFRK